MTGKTDGFGPHVDPKIGQNRVITLENKRTYSFSDP